MTIAEQNKYVNKILKEFRKSFWRAGHEYVESRFNLLNKELAEKYTNSERNSRYYDPLDRDQISNIYECLYNKNCNVFRIHLNSEYWGGYGVEAKFVLLNIISGTSTRFEHTVYSE
jgi:hypothetical protein